MLPYKALGLVDSGRGDFSPEQIVSPRDFGGGKGGGEQAEDAVAQARVRLQRVSIPGVDTVHIRVCVWREGGDTFRGSLRIQDNNSSNDQMKHDWRLPSTCGRTLLAFPWGQPNPLELEVVMYFTLYIYTDTIMIYILVPHVLYSRQVSIGL